MEKQIKTITAQRDELKEKMLEVMRENNCDKVDIDGKVLITRVAATTRESLDSKSLKADNPELYAKYVKTSPVKESLKITVRA
jgi:regulator of replication initiation timing